MASQSNFSPKECADARPALPVPDRDPDGDGERVAFPLRFPGQYHDAETGLHYNWRRYYDPETGRYISPDPIGLAGGMNRYAYAAANPVMNVDPMGLEVLKCRRRLDMDVFGLDFLYSMLLEEQRGAYLGNFSLSHSFICVDDEKTGKLMCDSTNVYSEGNIWDVIPIIGSLLQGQRSDPADDNPGVAACESVDDGQDRCLEKCVAKAMDSSREPYHIVGLRGGQNCHGFVDETLEECKARCRSSRGSGK